MDSGWQIIAGMDCVMRLTQIRNTSLKVFSLIVAGYLSITSALASIQLPVSIYDLNTTIVHSAFRVEEAVSLNGDSYFIGAHAGDGEVLWRHSQETNKTEIVPLPDYDPDFVYKLRKLTVVGEHIFIQAGPHIWRITPEHPNGKRFNTALLGFYFSIDQVLTLGEEMLFTVNPGVDKRNRPRKTLWKYDSNCACLSTFDIEQRVYIKNIDGKILAAADDVEYENASRLYLVNPDTNETLWVSQTDTDLANRFHDISISDAVVWEDYLIFSSRDIDKQGYLWRYNMETRELSEQTALNSHIHDEDESYYPEILAQREHLLVIQRSSPLFSFAYEKARPQKKLYLYNLLDNEVEHVSNLKHQNCESSDGEDTVLRNTYSAKVALTSDSLIYESDEWETGFRLWRYDLHSGAKKDITPEWFTNTRQGKHCGEQAFFTNQFILENDQLFFFTRNDDKQQGGVWLLALDSLTLSQLHVPRSNFAYRSVRSVGDDYLFTTNHEPIHGSIEQNYLWRLEPASGVISAIVDQDGNQMRAAEVLSKGELPLIYANNTVSGQALYQLQTDFRAKLVPQVASSTNSSSPDSFLVFGDKMYFLGDSGRSGRYLWQVTASGVPKLLPVMLGESRFGLSLTKVDDYKMLISRRDDDLNSSSHILLDTRTNIATPLTELDELYVKFVAHQDDIMYFSGKAPQSDIGQLWKLNLATRALGVGHDALPVTDSSNDRYGYFVEDRYIYHYDARRNGAKGIWRAELNSGTWQRLATDQDSDCWSFTTPKLFKLGDALYFSGDRFYGDGPLTRYNQKTGVTDFFGCVREAFPLGEDLITIEYDGVGGASINKISHGSSEKELIIEYAYDSNTMRDIRFTVSEDTLYFAAAGFDIEYNLYRYDGVNPPEPISTLRGQIDNLSVIDGEVFYTKLEPHTYKPKHLEVLYQLGDASPLLKFEDIDFDQNFDFFPFAGDLWGNGSPQLKGIRYDDELMRIHVSRATARRSPYLDFDGDGITDMGFREKTKRNWNILLSATGERSDTRFGLSENDIPVPADYDGDGITDLAFRRLDTKIWYVKNSNGSNFNSAKEDGIQRVVLGQRDEDIPVPADYDGDGITDMAVRRPSWYAYFIRYSSTGEIEQVKFGRGVNDIPVAGDFDGDGKADIAFHRPSNSTWYVKNSSGTNYNSAKKDGIQRVAFDHHEADVPTPADFDGDGITDLAVWRDSLSRFIVRYSGSGEVAPIVFKNIQRAVPTVGDYDGDGLADAAIYLADTGVIKVRYTESGKDAQISLSSTENAFPLALPIFQMMKLL